MLRFLLLTCILSLLLGPLPYGQGEYVIDRVVDDVIWIEPLNDELPPLSIRKKTFPSAREGDVILVTMGGNVIFRIKPLPEVTTERYNTITELLERISHFD